MKYGYLDEDSSEANYIEQAHEGHNFYDDLTQSFKFDDY